MAPPPAAPQPPPQQVRLFATDSQRRAQLRVMNGGGFKLTDLYHLLLRSQWRVVFAFIAVVYLTVNALFGGVYWWLGGIQNTDGGYLDHFFFSVQTFGTIGYGAMFPSTKAAQWLMVFESLVSLVTTAMVTGLIFAKFARPSARVLWSAKAVVCDRDGKPTLMFRMANERANHVVEAQLHAAIVRAEKTQEGESIRRVIDLPLVRSNSPTFILTWTAMHVIDEKSPLWGHTQETLANEQAEIVLTLMGLDDTIMQTIHARKSFLAYEVAWGAKFGDVIARTNNEAVLDYARMHEVVPARLTWETMGVKLPPLN